MLGRIRRRWARMVARRERRAMEERREADTANANTSDLVGSTLVALGAGLGAYAGAAIFGSLFGRDSSSTGEVFSSGIGVTLHKEESMFDIKPGVIVKVGRGGESGVGPFDAVTVTSLPYESGRRFNGIVPNGSLYWFETAQIIEVVFPVTTKPKAPKLSGFARAAASELKSITEKVKQAQERKASGEEELQKLQKRERLLGELVASFS